MNISTRNKYILTGIILIIGIALPLVTHAAIDVDLQSLLADFMDRINTITLPILISVEIILFIFGVIRYFMNPDADRTQASQFLMFTIAAIFATVALLGIVFFIQSSLGVGSGGTIQPPQLSGDITITNITSSYL